MMLAALYIAAGLAVAIFAAYVPVLADRLSRSNPAGCAHEHARFDPRGWPTGEDLEICARCGCSRTHWDGRPGPWIFVEDIEAERAFLEALLREDVRGAEMESRGVESARRRIE